MKPKPIPMKQDTLSEPPIYKSFKVETPMGSLESDSGSHIIDVASIIFVIAVLYIGKKLIGRYIKWKRRRSLQWKN